jgi:hypothetical protein
MVAASTFGPGAGTKLSPIKVKRSRPIAVAGDEQLVRVTLSPVDSAQELGALVAVGARLRRRQGLVAWLDIRNVHGTLPKTTVPTAIVTVIGQTIGEQPVMWAQGNQALEDAEISYLASASGGDELWWEVAPSELQAAEESLHERFIRHD